MSTTENTNKMLKDIVCPSINDVGYASGLETAFANINNNFNILANHDFIKGDTGDSLEIKSVNFYDYDEVLDKYIETSYVEKLKNCIKNGSTEIEQADVIHENTVLSLFGNFENDKAGAFQMIYKVEDNGIEKIYTPVSSLYYVFLDGRYANNLVGKIGDSQYNNKKDLSCIVVYDGMTGEFSKLDSAFPTIYYENGVGLCWKLNGNETGIPVCGLPGKDGINSSIGIVKVDSTDLEISSINSRGKVSEIYNNFDGYKSINEFDGIEEYDGKSVLVTVPIDNSIKFYFGQTKFVDNELYAYFSTNDYINQTIDDTTIVNFLKNIDLNNTSDINYINKGLFIPISKQVDGTQKVHLMTATSIAEHEGIDDLNTEVMITPVKDINNLVIDDENELKISKYLYLKFKNDIATGITNSGWNSINTEATNHYLKYKLADVIYSKDSSWFGVTLSPNLAISASRYYGTTSFYDSNDKYISIILSQYNTAYRNSKTGEISSDHFTSMPESFYKRLSDSNDENFNKGGLYRWELCDEYNDFDIDELKALNKTNYNFDKKFRVIFTTSVTPSASTDFMWFDGMEILETTPVGDNSNIWIIPGWSNALDESYFKFIKFVPVYENDFSIVDDTALNLNYNINITGDVDNPTKSLTVHGDINCDNLSVYRLTATDEIQNIYTRDDIKADAGLNVGYNPDAEEYMCTIDNEGNINAKSISVDDTKIAVLTTETIVADNVKTGNLELNMESEGETYNNIKSKFSIQPSTIRGTKDSISISGNGIHKIDIETRSYQTYGKLSEMPLVTSNAPVHMNDMSNIVVSNQPKTSLDVYYKNMLRDDDDSIAYAGSGVGTGSNILTTSFESAKNFNMYRMAVSSGGGDFIEETNELVNTDNDENISTLGQNGSSSTSESAFNFIFNSNSTIGQSSMTSDNRATSNITYDYVTKNYLMSTTIQHKDNIVFDDSSEFVINMNDTYWTTLGIKGGYSGDNGPILSNTSFMSIGVYYTVGNSKTVYFLKHSDVDNRKFNKSGTSSYTGKWCGADYHGVQRDEDIYANLWRYISFITKITDTITINKGIYSVKLRPEEADSSWKAFINHMNSENSITFYVVPTFYIKAIGKNNKEVINGIRLTAPRCLSFTSSINSINPNFYNTIWYSNEASNGRLPSTNPICYPLYKNPTKSNSSMKYTYLKKESDSGSENNFKIKSNSICNDGMVIRSGKYVFGLGMAENIIDHSYVGYETEKSHWKTTGEAELNYKQNIPILFYHEFDSKMYNSDGTPRNDNNVTSKGYAQRTNSIPLEDIFNAIKHIRETKGAWSQFGL